MLTLALALLTTAALVLAHRLATSRGELAHARADLAALSARADAERAAHQQQLADVLRAGEEKLALVRGGREELTRDMEAISANVLRQATEQLVKATSETRKVDHEQLGRAIDPFATHLKRLEQQVTELERERKRTEGDMGRAVRMLSEGMERLRNETGSLVNALRKPQIRGSWGEMQLRNVVEAAGMTAHVDFHDQRTYTDADGGRLRPDMTVHLPGGRDLVVDAKVPLEAYLAALEADEGKARDLELDRHARQLRQHLDTLASKAYHLQLDASPEFVVCFLPNEGIYCAALERDPGLLEYGSAKGVLLATPMTLLGLLKATYYGWRQETIAESAREIADAARELHKRVGTFLQPFAKLGRQLGSATNAYNEAAASMEARVLPQLRRIEEAGASSGRELEPPTPLDTPARLITAPELRDADSAPEQLEAA